MDINIFAIIQSLYESFVASVFFHFLKNLSAFVIAVLLIADILLLSKRARGDWKIAVYGAKIPDLKKSKYAQKWIDINKKIESGDLSQAKVALIEADQMFSEALDKIGYEGKDTGERIAQVRSGQLIGLEEAVQSHEIFKKVVHDSGYGINLEEIKTALAGYERVFMGLELLG
ncbi:MAG: hypothetical protein PHF35_03845 [Candidatus Moranbacteria bacterium]|nr:hypothetical protein [Candidatus Moranbacteria bacterium]